MTSCFTFDADLIIGQTMINSDNISLITSAASIRFVQNNALQEIFTDINLKSSDFNRKYPIYLKHSVNIPVVILCWLWYRITSRVHIFDWTVWVQIVT